MNSVLDPNPSGYPTLVLLHGLGASKDSWVFQIDPFVKANMRPVAMDIPGFGEAPPPPHCKWEIPKVAGDLARQIKSITDEPVILIGLSLGGCLSLQIILDHPGIVGGAVLVNTFASLRNSHPSEVLYFLRRGFSIGLAGMEKQAALVAERVFPHPGQELYRQTVINEILASDPVVYRRAMIELFRLNLAPRLPEIDCPVLIISGEEDSTVSKRTQEVLVGSIRSSTQVIISDSGHATPVDQPEAFNAEVIKFVSQVTKIGSNLVD
ncbi:MAG: alpha/beta hydrolase [Anaerolineae bacterium]|jgi:pimeloyl-ACP methyl ester carboxylesterase|nr:alpha/beta hydrolase [Anaerolineae bacterium]